nr:hypothetical protein [Lactococcus petauri]
MDINVKLAEHQKIETSRLWLRPFVMSDAVDMFEYSSDSSNLRFVFNPIRISHIPNLSLQIIS